MQHSFDIVAYIYFFVQRRTARSALSLAPFANSGQVSKAFEHNERSHTHPLPCANMATCVYYASVQNIYRTRTSKLNRHVYNYSSATF